MRRLLSLAIVCGALTQFGPVCPADDWDDDDWEDASDGRHGRPGWQPVHSRHHVPPGYGYGHWHYYHSGYGPGVWILVPPAEVNDPHHAPVGAVPNDGRIAAAGGSDHWLGDMSLYENDDPVPAPMSLAPVSVPDSPPGLIPPAPAGQQHHGGPQGFDSGPRPFTPDEPPLLERQARLEPIPDERFRFSVDGPAGNPALTLKPGEFAPARVPLYPWVSVDRARNIAPGAVPVVVAVRHPQICPFPCRCHREQVAFAEVWVPQWQARQIKVKKHGTEVELDYGSYRVKVESRKGWVKVQYHD